MSGCSKKVECHTNPFTGGAECTETNSLPGWITHLWPLGVFVAFVAVAFLVGAQSKSGPIKVSTQPSSPVPTYQKRWATDIRVDDLVKSDMRVPLIVQQVRYEAGNRIVVGYTNGHSQTFSESEAVELLRK